MKIFLILLSLLMLPLSVSAENAMRIDHSINSKYPEQLRALTVHLPESYYSQPTHHYPLLVLLDGESNLDYSVAVSDFLSENALMPELIIVALHAGSTRGQDYLPSNGQAESTGNADQFLRYIAEEMLPFIEKNYRASTFRFLSGHSYGGVFTTYAMTQAPDLFKGYFAQSPFLDETIGNPLIEHVASFLENNDNLDGFYYMNLGDEPNLNKNFNKLKVLLQEKAPASFKWSAQQHAGKTHMTTRLVGQYDALEQFYAEDWPLSQAAIVSGKAAAVKAHIDGLSKKYGYSILYNEQLFTQATQILFAQQDVGNGTQMAQLYTQQYPQSPIAYFFLANGLGSSGNIEQASAAITTAIQLYEANPQPELQTLYAGMQQLKQQLGG